MQTALIVSVFIMKPKLMHGTGAKNKSNNDKKYLLSGENKKIIFSVLTLCLLAASAHYLCKQTGPRSGPTRRRA